MDPEKSKLHLSYVLIDFILICSNNLFTYFVQPHWARAQVRGCYFSFAEQFQHLPPQSVIWEPYSDDALMRRAPHMGMSSLCRRDESYWRTTSKLLFDIFVEDHSPHCVMRQFGLYQTYPPPHVDPVDANTHT